MTLVITAIVTSAAVTGVVALNQHTFLLKQRAAVETDAKLLTDVLVSELQGAGGGSVRPWHVIAVDNDYSNGSDRLILASLEPDFAQCNITGHNGINRFDIATDAGEDSDECCLTAAGAGAWGGRMLIAVDGANGAATRLIRSAGVSATATDCSVTFASPTYGLELDQNVPNLNALVPGVLTAVNVSLYEVDHTTRSLVRWVDTNGDGNLERFVIADQVYDLQVALGYDVNGDRSVSFDGTAADEFLYNHGSDAWGSGGLDGARSTQLRMVQVGVIVGVPSRLSTGSAQSLDGPQRSLEGTLLRATHGRAFLRNLSLYDQ